VRLWLKQWHNFWLTKPFGLDVAGLNVNRSEQSPWCRSAGYHVVSTVVLSTKQVRRIQPRAENAWNHALRTYRIQKRICIHHRRIYYSPGLTFEFQNSISIIKPSVGVSHGGNWCAEIVPLRRRIFHEFRAKPAWPFVWTGQDAAELVGILSKSRKQQSGIS